MTVKLGYLLPTREQIMDGRSETASLLLLAEQAEALGYDSVWAGDSLLARPRHEPLTLLAGVAARTRKIQLGTAVLLPALRNPVLLAHTLATLDQLSEGRLIVGAGIAADVQNIRDEFAAAGVPFEKRVGRMLEGLNLCRALWTGEPVDWDGRWQVRQGVLAPLPCRRGGPPLWAAASTDAGLERVGKYFDGWFPIGPDPETVGERWTKLQNIARSAGRDPSALTCAVYLTVAVDDNAERAGQRIDDFLSAYYRQDPHKLKRWMACFAGDQAALVAWLQRWLRAGVSHIVLRFAGDHQRHLHTIAQLRAELIK